MVCGSVLTYLHRAEPLVCAYCGKNDKGHVKCPSQHYVCEACHAGDMLSVITSAAISSLSRDTAGFAEMMMCHPNLPMLGCEHTYITAGALMAGIRNSPYGKGKVADDDIREVLGRTAKQAVSGYCGLTGVCGVAPAIGACVSLFLGARCGSDSEQRIVMDAVNAVSRAIADLTGPSCCKAYVRTALDTAVTFFGERFGIILPVADRSIICKDPGRHPHGCREEKCPYFRKPAQDLFAPGKFVPGTVCVS